MKALRSFCVLAVLILPTSLDSLAASAASPESLDDDLEKSSCASSAMPSSPRIPAATLISSAISVMDSSRSAPPPAIWFIAAETSACTLLMPALSVILPSGTCAESFSSMSCTASRISAAAKRCETSIPACAEETSSLLSPSESASSSATERRTEMMFDE